MPRFTASSQKLANQSYKLQKSSKFVLTFSYLQYNIVSHSVLAVYSLYVESILLNSTVVNCMTVTFMYNQYG